MKAIFISAELSTLDKATNNFRTNSLERILKSLTAIGLTVEMVQGVYKGSKETSFKISGKDINVPFFQVLAKRFDQESILMLDENNKSYLYYPATNMTQFIGTMMKTDNVEGIDCYSVINGELFIVA